MVQPATKRLVTEASVPGHVAAGIPARLSDTNLAATYVGAAQRSNSTDGALLDKAYLGGVATVVTSGHSQMYGLGGTGALPAINGLDASQTRSTNSPPEALLAALQVIKSDGWNLVNHAVAGQGTTDYLNQWLNTTHGDVEIIWHDSNDQSITPAQQAANMNVILSRMIADGSQPIVIGGNIVKDRTAANIRNFRSDVAKSVATRFGVPFIDVAELLNGLESVENIWSDTVHLSDAAYASIGTRLSALFGPKGVTPPRVSAGSRVLPNHHMIIGGTVTERPDAIDGRTIKLTAGQTVMVPVQVDGACAPIVRYYSDATNGGGVARLRYVLSKADRVDRRATITTTKRDGFSLGSGQRGHLMRGGPDVIFITCVSGSVEIERIDFVDDSQDIGNGAGGFKMLSSKLSGSVAMGSPINGAAWNQQVDLENPFGGTASAGGNSNWRVDWEGTLGAVGTQAVFIASSVAKDPLNLPIMTGYALRRAGGSADLTIREFKADTTTPDVTVTGVFPAGAEFSGTLSIACVAGSAQVYVNGVAAGAAFTPTYSQYYVGTYGAAGAKTITRAFTIQAGETCV